MTKLAEDTAQEFDLYKSIGGEIPEWVFDAAYEVAEAYDLRQNPSSHFAVVWQNVDGAGVFPERFVDIDEAIANAQGRQLIADGGGNHWHEFYTVVQRWPATNRRAEVFTTAPRSNPKARKGCRDAAGNFVPTPACRGKRKGKAVKKAPVKKRSKGRKSVKKFMDF